MRDGRRSNDRRQSNHGEYAAFRGYFRRFIIEALTGCFVRCVADETKTRLATRQLEVTNNDCMYHIFQD